MEVLPFLGKARSLQVSDEELENRLQLQGYPQLDLSNIQNATMKINEIRERSNAYAVNATKRIAERRRKDLEELDEKKRKVTEYSQFAGKYYYENREGGPAGSELVYFNEARRFVDQANKLREEIIKEEQLENDFEYIQAMNTAIELLDDEINKISTELEKKVKGSKRDNADFTRVYDTDDQYVILLKDALVETQGGRRVLKRDLNNRISLLQKAKIPQKDIREKTMGMIEWSKLEKKEPKKKEPMLSADRPIEKLQEKIKKIADEGPVIDGFFLSEKYGGDLNERVDSTKCDPILKIKDGRIDYETYDRRREERKYDHTYAKDSFIREKAYARREYRQIMEEHAFDITNVTAEYQKMETNDGRKMVRVISLYPNAYSKGVVNYDENGKILTAYDGPYGRVNMTEEDEDIYQVVIEEIQQAFNEWILYTNTLYFHTYTEKYLPYIKFTGIDGHFLRSRILYTRGNPGIMFEININLARADFEQFVARQVTKYVSYYFTHIIFGANDNLHNRHWISLMRSLMNHGVAKKYYDELGKSFRPLKESEMIYRREYA